ncbi:MAG TPA: hypothetical protein VEW70_07615 [Burkholderiales bacterium]|nr:hypothetical protein [Burkholderiales bacterium]
MTKKSKPPAVPADLSAYLATIGAKGGSASGKAKKRGTKALYRELQLKAAASRKANNAARAKELAKE